MDFVPVRDFRIRPRDVWRRLRRSKKLLVISNGKPVAMLTDIEGRDLEDELKAESMARGILALSKLRETARAKGLDKLTPDEIDHGIRQARKTL